MKYTSSNLLIAFGLCYALAACNSNSTDSTRRPPAPENGTVEQWFTKADESQLLQKQTTLLAFTDKQSQVNTIEINENKALQSVEGFGYTLTGSSAYLLNRMSAAERGKLLNEFFATTNPAVGVSYLRVSIGASDLSPTVFSYNDLPAGQTDELQTKFDLAADKADLIPVLKEILAINPAIKIMGSPWSPPTWMKSNNNSMGGSLLPRWYASYALYFVKYVQAMKQNGITIDAITIQNEPQHGGNNPSMLMTAAEQAEFIKNHLGPAFRDAGITTKIIVWDHNCNHPEYPIAVLNDAAAKQFVAGSAFHLYEGDISALSQVKAAHPDKDLYFTEQWTGSKSDFSGDFKWHIRNVIIGSMRNWSRVALEWNLANDPTFGPHTPGGCTECKGAVTLNGNSVQRNVAYYIIAQIAKFVPAGSQRIETNAPSNIPAVAFKTPQGKRVLLVLNDGANSLNLTLRHNGLYATAQLPANTASTYVW